jgi:hypothetical protein
VIVHFFNKHPEWEDNRGPQPPPNHQQILVQCSRPKAGSSPTPSSTLDLGSKPGRGPSIEQSIESFRTFVNYDGEKLAIPLGPRVPGSLLRRDSEETTIREASLEQNGKKPTSSAVSSGSSNTGSRSESAEDARPHPLSQG